MESKYKDLINLPHPISKHHAPMSITNRAAQFAPFAALTGYDEAIDEMKRLTCDKIELDEDHKQILNVKLQFIQEQIRNRPEITISYFQKDASKEGGTYLELTGRVQKIDEFSQSVWMENGEQIQINDIYEIDCGIDML